MERVGFWEGLWRGSLGAEAAGPDADTWPNEIDRRKIEFLSPYLPASGSVIEVGCGSGRLLCRVGLTLSRSGTPSSRLVALDSAPAALSLARQTADSQGLSIECVEGDALKLPFDEGTFDLMLSGGLLEHFEDPAPVLAEMVRVLRPGGVFYADVVPRKLSWYRLHDAVRMARSSDLAPGVHESSYGPARYRQWLGSLGVDDLQIVSCGVYPSIIERLPGRARRLLSSITRPLDGGIVAGALGWYFMIAGRKRARADDT